MQNTNVYNISGSSEPKNEILEILEEVKSGQTSAFGKIYDLYFLKIYRFIYYRTGHKENAEDLSEEVFIKAFEKITALKKTEAFEAWLYQIARNLIIDHYRRQKFTVALEDVENTLEYESNIIDVLNLENEQKTLIRLLKQLSSDEQSVLKMKFLEDLDNQTIAAILDKTEGAIRVIQHRGITKLKKLSASDSITNGKTF